ncbi:MAG: hypothetical protein R3F37_18680 [Candidatus Competibacteraceae bacterium]
MVEVGASNEQSTSRRHGITGYSASTRQDQQRIQLRVDCCPDSHPDFSLQ